MHIPAFCDNCGAVFRSGIVVENSINITFSGNRAGPCPVCGGVGHIPDGVFNFIDNTIEILSAPKRTLNELSHLTNILREAKEKHRSPDEVAEKIREDLPELSSVADLLPKTRSELYAFLTLIVAVIGLLTQGSHGSNNTSTITVNQTINQAFLETDKVAKPKGSVKAPAKRISPKIGRNEPCPCGSGKKYKKCCGQPQ